MEPVSILQRYVSRIAAQCLFCNAVGAIYRVLSTMIYTHIMIVLRLQIFLIITWLLVAHGTGKGKTSTYTYNIICSICHLSKKYCSCQKDKGNIMVQPGFKWFIRFTQFFNNHYRITHWFPKISLIVWQLRHDLTVWSLGILVRSYKHYLHNTAKQTIWYCICIHT